MNRSFSEAPANGVSLHARRRRHASVGCRASAKRSEQDPETYINTELAEPKLVLDRMAPDADTDTRTGLSASQLSSGKGMHVAGQSIVAHARRRSVVWPCEVTSSATKHGRLEQRSERIIGMTQVICIVESPGTAPPGGHYSHGVGDGDRLFVAGPLAIRHGQAA